MMMIRRGRRRQLQEARKQQREEGSKETQRLLDELDNAHNALLNAVTRLTTTSPRAT